MAALDGDRRVFTPDDQERFARLSGDRNPMHMDAEAARRTQAGRPAVHGIHMLLWALDRMAATGRLPAAPFALKVDFRRFLPVGEPVALEVAAVGERTTASLLAGGTRAVAATLQPAAGAVEGVAPADPAPVPAAPAEPGLAALAAHAGALASPPGAAEAAAALFPAAAAALGPHRLAGLALLSSLVGMVAPGLHSIFSGLSVSLAGGGGAAIGWRAERLDERFRLLTLRIGGAGLAGSVAAFARFPPVAPLGMAQAARLVATDAFAGRTALVVGGSRGIGAATAKLLAAGGARVAMTWRSGRAEAEAIAAEIAAAKGPDSVAALRYDAAGSPQAQLAALGWPVSHLYYFATGQIGAAGADFAPVRHAGFLAVYVTAFHALVEHLARGAERLTVLYPSSVFVETRPRGMTEYAMAKAAGEILCADLARARRGLAITAPRLPRILTDQTATVPPLPAADPAEVMLPLLLAQG